MLTEQEERSLVDLFISDKQFGLTIAKSQDLCIKEICNLLLKYSTKLNPFMKFMFTVYTQYDLFYMCISNYRIWLEYDKYNFKLVNSLKLDYKIIYLRGNKRKSERMILIKDVLTYSFNDYYTIDKEPIKYISFNEIIDMELTIEKLLLC